MVNVSGTYKFIECIFGELNKNDSPICTMTGYDVNYPFEDSCGNCSCYHTRRDAAKIIKELLQSEN